MFHLGPRVLKQGADLNLESFRAKCVGREPIGNAANHVARVVSEVTRVLAQHATSILDAMEPPLQCIRHSLHSFGRLHDDPAPNLVLNVD